MGTGQNNMGGSSLTLQLTCGTKGHTSTQFGEDATATGAELRNVASTYFHVKGTGIGRASDDGDMEPLPANHPGRAWGAKRWGDLWGATMQPRYEVDILLTATPQLDPPVYFATGTYYDPIFDEEGKSTRGRIIGTQVEDTTATVTRRYDTIYWNERVNLRRYCEINSTETVTVTVNGRITGRRPL